MTNDEPPRLTATINETLQQAMLSHRQGQLRDAERLYRAILDAQPDHPDANHNLGVLAVQMKQPASGLSHFAAALAADPTCGQYWLSYLDALFQAGQQDEARQVLAFARQQGLEGDEVDALGVLLEGDVKTADQCVPGNQHAPKEPMPGAAMVSQGKPSHESKPVKSRMPAGKYAANKGRNPRPEDVNRVLALFNQGRFTEAATLAHAMTRQFPLHQFGWKALGAAYKQMGRSADALVPMQKAASLAPGDAEAHNNLGVTLHELGRFLESEASCRQALKIMPDFAEAHNNLGNALRGLGRLSDAEACYRRALELMPEYAEAHSNLGNVLYDWGRLKEAEASYRRALELMPDYAVAHNNLGNTFQDLGRLDEAEACFRKALQNKPDYLEAHNNLGSVLKDLGRLDEAEASFRRALQIRPDYADAFDVMLFALNYHPDRGAEEIYRVYREYDATRCMPLRSAWRAHHNDRNPDRRLRVGYVSPDFRHHSCRYFLEPLLAHHDKTQVEVYAYAELIKEDHMTARYKNYVDHWVPTKGMSDEALSARIRADGIDILVELAGHTAANRLLTFARKPAPVSLSWLGYGYTTGVSAIDYYLTDEVSAPTGSEGLFAEKPWRVATPSHVYRPTEGMGEVNSLPALQRGYITFGTLTRSVRVNHRTIRVWSAILNAVPDSRLIMDSGNFSDPIMQERMASRFTQYGIAHDRLEIGFHSPPWDTLRSMDIGLDCFPHNSGTTLYETLYMGVPYITLAERPSVGRLGSSILHGVGHSEWIAENEDEYVAKAVELASDVRRLSEIRSSLRGWLESSPLRDEEGFARKVEDAYRRMWRIWCERGDET